AGRAATWLVERGQPGPVAIANIGYVGYRTGYPVVDLLGLVAPEIARLPGGGKRKGGARFTGAVFGKNPRYFVIVSSGADCKTPSLPTSRAVFDDPRFAAYALASAIHLKGGGAWCIYAK